MVVFAAASVFVQRKFFHYHWAAVWPFLALMATWSLVELVSSMRVAVMAAIFSIALLVLAGILSQSRYYAYSHHIKTTWSYLRGEITQRQFLDKFRGPFGNDQFVLQRIAELIRQRAKPNDTLCVRGFMPAIYVLSGLRCPSRFPWEQHLGGIWEPPLSSYPDSDIRSIWVNQHRLALAIHRPTFLVTFENWSVDRFARSTEGYREIGVVDGHVLMVRRH
jgi:hypothetical protein